MSATDDNQTEEGEILSQGSVEDGEILDDTQESEGNDSQIPQLGATATECNESFIPLISVGQNRHEEYGSDEEDYDEPPEEILNRYARERTLNIQPEQFLDPALCRVCKKEPHKYRCPRCNVRSCSLECSKKHKEQNVCDGIRPPFQPVACVSQFDGRTSVKDQEWMTGVQNKIKPESNAYDEYLRHAHPPRHQLPLTIEDIPHAVKMEPSGENVPSDQNDEPSTPTVELNDRGFPQFINEDGTRNSANNATERYLLPNAHRRRIFLSFSNDKGDDNSRHEQFSDNIFWCIDLIFRKQLADGTYDDYNYRIQNIPETIRICTILKQFLKPRKYGHIVSESDLDMIKMHDFIEAGLENLVLLMRVPRYYKERYYLVNPEKNMLDNLRNRVVVDHPKIIITQGTQCCNMTMAEAEAEELRSNMSRERSAQMGPRRGGQNGYRGNRGHGGPMYNGPSNNNFRGRGSHHRPRPYDRSPAGNDYRGRGGMRGRGRGGGGNRGGYRQRRDLDTFDPFEPFKGRQTLPDDYGMRPPQMDNRGHVGSDTFNGILTWENIKKEIPADVPPPPIPPSATFEYIPPTSNDYGL